MEFTLFLLFL